MGAANLFKRDASNDANAVTRIQELHAAAQARLEAAREAYGNALQDLTQDGAVDLQAVTKARAKLEAAEAEERAGREALGAVRARHAAAEAEAARKATGARYDEAIRAAKARIDTARTIGRLLTELATAYGQINAQTETMQRVLPDAKDLDGAVMRQSQVEGLLKLEMYRVGLPGFTKMQPRHEVASIDDRLAETPGLLLSWKHWALGGLHG